MRASAPRARHPRGMSADTPSKKRLAGQTTLYRFYDETGELLYVGVAVDPGRRFEQHRAGKTWWTTAARIDLVHYETRDEALAAERQAIKDEQPKFNIAHSVTGRANAVVVWCSVCDNVVEPGAGYLTISHNDISAYNACRREANDTGDGFVDIAALLAGPGPAQWRGYHAACDPVPDGPDYWFGSQRFTTWHDVIRVTAHLLGKTWLEDTNWDEVLEGILTNKGPLRTP